MQNLDGNLRGKLDGWNCGRVQPHPKSRSKKVLQTQLQKFLVPEAASVVKLLQLYQQESFLLVAVSRDHEQGGDYHK